MGGNVGWKRTSILVELRTFSDVSQLFIERDSMYLLLIYKNGQWWSSSQVDKVPDTYLGMTFDSDPLFTLFFDDFTK